jgi:hypothetical protein
MVNEVGAAGSGRDHVTLKVPTLATWTVPSSRAVNALVVSRTDRRLSFFDVKRGGPVLGRLPVGPSRKFRQAVSRSRGDCRGITAESFVSRDRSGARLAR